MNEINCDEQSNIISLKEDPAAQLSLVDKYVVVQMIKNCSFVGYIHAIDPVTHSIVLSVPKEENYQTTLIPGHAILDIIETEPLLNSKPPMRKQLPTVPEEDTSIKKTKLISWLKFNLIPVTESNEKIMFGNVSILPPYNVNNICTDNAIVALQIRKLIEKMPQDYVPNHCT